MSTRILRHFYFHRTRDGTVWFQRSSKFWARNSSGKYQMDVQEIRASVLLSEALPDRIRGFRADRLAMIEAGDTPVPLDPNETGKLVVHLVPLSAFGERMDVDLKPLMRDVTATPLPFGNSWVDSRWNLDGIATYSKSEGARTPHTYLQIFRSGIFEVVEAGGIVYRYGGQKYIRGDYENNVVKRVTEYLGIEKSLGVEPPFSLC